MTQHHWQCEFHCDQVPQECTCGLTGPRAWRMDWLPADRAPTAAEVIAMDVEAERLKAECRGKA